MEHNPQSALDTFYELVRTKEIYADRIALFCRITSNIFLLYLLISGVIVGLLAKTNFVWKDTTLLILGVGIVLVKTIMSTVNLDQLSLTYKQISIKLRDLSLTILMANNLTDTQLREKLISLYREFDQLDQSLFSENFLGKLSPNGTPHSQTITFLRRQSGV